MIVLLRFSLDVCEETGFFQHVLFHLEDHHKTPSDIQVAAKCFSGLLSTLVYMNFLSGRPPGGGNGSLLQYSCLENSMDRGALVGYSPWGSSTAPLTCLSTYLALTASSTCSFSLSHLLNSVVPRMLSSALF